MKRCALASSAKKRRARSCWSHAVAASSIAKLMGQSASFALSAVLLAATDSSSMTVGVLVVGPVVAAVIIGVALPETSRRELTDLAVAAV